MTFRLYLQFDGQWVPTCELDLACEYTLGRSRSNDIVVSDERCSRVHLKFAAKDDVWFVNELDASNPTYVGEERVTTERTLSVGDVIAIGSHTLILFSDSALPQKTTGRGDVSSLIDHVKHDEGERRAQAQRDLFAHYYERLCQLAKNKSGGLDGRVEDAEDAVASAWKSFFFAIENGRLGKIDNRNDLWRVLATFTARKVIRQRERQQAQKRASNRTVTDSALSGPSDSQSNQPGMEGLADDSLNHELEIAFRESLEIFLLQLNEELRFIAKLRLLEHLSDAEIGQRLTCSERTIKRRVLQIRMAWNQYTSEQDEQ